ncbi:hypothetical protein P9112_008291 [Eukaryota sp. TZLM1-RC]
MSEGNNKYRKPKPDLDPNFDTWAMEKFEPGDMKHSLAEESSFKILFPQYREAALRLMWPQVTQFLRNHHIECTLNLVEGFMTVNTTRKTWDPYAIICARDMLKCIARSVPFPEAKKVFTDGVYSEIIQIGKTVENKDRFVRRRQRLVGPNGSTLKALQILTGCYIHIQGTTVTAIGPFKGLKQVKSVVMDCMKNIHPVYNIKELMIKRELMKNPELQNESWDRFLPKFKSRNIQRKKVSKLIAQRKKKEYTPFPPEITPRKVDLEMESGEYFYTQEQKDEVKKEREEEKRRVKMEEKRKERESEYIAPEEKRRNYGDEGVEKVEIGDLVDRFKEKNDKKKGRKRRKGV